MSDPIRVSAAEFKRLEMIQQMRSGGAPKDEKRDVAAEVWDTTKKVGKWYLIFGGAWSVIVIVLAILMGIWLCGSMGQTIAHNNAQFQRFDEEQRAHDALPSVPMPDISGLRR